MVFPSKKGTLRSSGVLTAPLREACKLAGIAKPVSAHWFRHTLSSLVRQASDRKVARSITGHVTEHLSEHYDRATLNERRVALSNVVTNVFTKRPVTSPEGSESP